MQVTLHWRTGAEPGRLIQFSNRQATIEMEGYDDPFVFDAGPEGWVEHDWGGHMPIQITDEAGRAIPEDSSCAGSV